MPKIIEKLPEVVLSQEEEFNFLNESKEFLEKELGFAVDIVKAQDSKEAKAKQAMPGKVAIVIS